LILWFLEDLNIGYPVGCLSPDELATTAPEQQLSTALKLTLERTTLHAQVSAQQLEPIFKVFQGIVTATCNYRASTIAAPMLIVRAQDNQVSEFFDHPAGQAQDWGWSPYTTGIVRSHCLAGNHYTLLNEPHLQAVVQAIKKT
jgi:thioesterase domain-containing protein